VTLKRICEVICWKLDAVGLYKTRKENYEIKYDSMSYFNKVS